MALPLDESQLLAAGLCKVNYYELDCPKMRSMASGHTSRQQANVMPDMPRWELSCYESHKIW
jgi:hypothetical protein